MSGYSLPSGEQDPMHLVRTIGRLSLMLLEIRDEYAHNPRPDTLDQFERRLAEITELGRQLRELRLSQEEQDTASDPTT